MIGQIIGNYRIRAELGRGGMGEVYLADDVRLGRRVALKLLPDRCRSDPKAVERFVGEARAASALNHPNIVTVHDIGETDTGRFIAMEFVQGQNLRSLTATPLTLEKLAEIATQVAAALAVAHAADIIHRDIKPENIMVRDDGYVKVLDFGLAADSSPISEESVTRTATAPGTIIGTLRYMSPEQARAEQLTVASDIFSLGLVLYELATGKHPYASDSQISTVHGILSEHPIPPSCLNPAIGRVIDGLILQMLEKDPGRRPTAGEIRAALCSPSLILPPESSPPGRGRRLVGRKKQLAELRAAFQAVDAGFGLVVCVSGEPGIGKTTLVDDFCLELSADSRNCLVARGRCSERLAGSEAYLPFLEALEVLVRGSAAAMRLMKLLAPTWYVQIMPLSVHDSSVAVIISEAKAASQERIKRELAAFLLEVTRVKTVVLFLDDLHWADLSTLDLLSYLGSKCGSMRLLIIGTYRTSQVLIAKHPLLQIKLELQGRGLCRDLPLDFLSREDIETYLALEFPENRFPPELPALIHSKTEGSPLFMTDVVRYLRDRRVIARELGHWTLAQSLPSIEEALPESVRSMIERKIDELGEDDRRLLVAASVQGNEFESAVVAKALAIDPALVDDRLDILERVYGFVRLSGEHELPDSTLSLRYSFVHVLYQNALYATLTATRRASLSAAVAKTLLEFHGASSSEIAADLALLLETARDFAHASYYFLIAARNAAAVYATREAIGLFERAITNSQKARDDRRHMRIYEAAMGLARIYETGRRVQEAIEAYGLAEKAAADADDATSQVQAICAKGNVLLFFAKRAPACREECDRALQLANREQSPEALAAVNMVRYLERVCEGDFEIALQSYDRAAPVLHQRGLSPANLLGLNIRGAFHGWRLEYRQGDETLDWALRKAQEVGDVPRILQNHFFRAMSLGRQGRLGEALDLLLETRRLAELTGERVQLARLPNTIAWIHRESLDLEGALELNLESIPITVELGDTESEINSRINAGQVYLLLGESTHAFEQLDLARRLLEGFQWFRWLFQVRLECELASYWIGRGDLKQARSHASGALEITGTSLTRKHMAWARKLLGDIAVLEEHMDEARREYDKSLRVVEEYPCPPLEWRIRKARAEFVRQIGNDAGSSDDLARSRQIVDSLSASIRDGHLRQIFLSSRAALDLGK